VYSQFFLLTEQACIKLTSELLIQRKNEAIYRFQETARMMEEKMQQTLVEQDGILVGMDEQNDYLYHQREAALDFKVEIDRARQKMVSWNEFVEEQGDAISTIIQVS